MNCTAEQIALAYLKETPLLHMGMIEPICRGSGVVLSSDPDGVLLYERESGAHMVSARNPAKGESLLALLPGSHLMAVHQSFLVQPAWERFGLCTQLECWQAVYLGHSPLPVSEELELRPLDLSWLDVLLEHYHKVSPEELKLLLERGALVGGFWEGQLVGFVGTHLEGSIGLLEVLPAFRGQGYGTLLESYMTNEMLKRGRVPFCQVELGNIPSLGLQRKLGYALSQEPLYWLLEPAQDPEHKF